MWTQPVVYQPIWKQIVHCALIVNIRIQPPFWKQFAWAIKCLKCLLFRSHWITKQTIVFMPRSLKSIVAGYNFKWSCSKQSCGSKHIFSWACCVRYGMSNKTWFSVRIWNYTYIFFKHFFLLNTYVAYPCAYNFHVWVMLILYSQGIFWGK